MSQEELAELWDVVRDIILERVTRNAKRKRPAVAEAKLKEWVLQMDPEVELADLPDYCKERIEDIN